MNVQDLHNIFGPLQQLGNIKLPATASYRVGKGFKKLQSVLNEFEKKRMALAAELGTISKDGSKFEFTPENDVIFKDKMNIALAVEVNIDLPKLAIADLANVNIEPSILAALDGIIIFDTLDLKLVDSKDPAVAE
jgi:hypothetical protein